MVRKAKGKEMELRQVLVALGKDWSGQERKLKELLLAEGVCCVLLDRGQMEEAEKGKTGSGLDTVVLTDDRILAGKLAGRGVVCVGCDASGDRFFEGAALVTDALETLDARTLEECLLRATGRPVTIAVTERLVIREITERDLPGLCRIGEYSEVYQDPEDTGGDCFEPERMRAYIRNVYRFYGYGLWSVLLHDGTLVGCCGFADYADGCGSRKETDECGEDAGEGTSAGPGGRKQEREAKLCLELQYIVAEGLRRQGYGEEMCRAALGYARERLQADEIWVRAGAENHASLGLAEKLGFTKVYTDSQGIAYFRRDA